MFPKACPSTNDNPRLEKTIIKMHQELSQFSEFRHKQIKALSAKYVFE